MVGRSGTLKKLKFIFISFLMGLALLLLLGVPSMSGSRDSGEKFSAQRAANIDNHDRNVQKVQGGLLQMKSTAP